MAITTTLSSVVTSTAWTPIIDGTTIASCSIQLAATSTSVYLAVGQTTPALTSDDFIEFDRQRDFSYSTPLNATDKVYARAPSGTPVKVRWSQVTR